MARLRFVVKSSSSDSLYDLEAYQTKTGIRFSCTCDAAENGTHCKHRIMLLLGDTKSLDTSSKSTVSELATLVEGSETLRLVKRLTSLEGELSALQKLIKSEKKALAAAFYG